jgi:hypothetical protein
MTSTTIALILAMVGITASIAISIAGAVQAGLFRGPHKGRENLLQIEDKNKHLIDIINLDHLDREDPEKLDEVLQNVIEAKRGQL